MMICSVCKVNEASEIQTPCINNRTRVVTECNMCFQSRVDKYFKDKKKTNITNTLEGDFIILRWLGNR